MRLATKFVGNPDRYQLAVHGPTRSIALLLPVAPEFTRTRQAYALVPWENDIRLIETRVSITCPSINYVPRNYKGKSWGVTIPFPIEIKYNDPCEMFARAIDDGNVRERIWEDAGAYTVPRVYARTETVRAFRRDVRGAECENVWPLEESK